MSNEAAIPCPRCGHDSAFYEGPVLDKDGFLLGDCFVCKGCETHWTELRENDGSMVNIF